MFRKQIIGWLAVMLLGGAWLGRAAEAVDEAEAEAARQTFLSQFQWVTGPATAEMKQVAKIGVPEGYMFTDGDGTRRLLEAMGNLTDESEMGFLSPTNLDWFVVFSFSEDGYVKDDEKNDLDAVAMLKVIRKGNEYANQEKSKMGLSPMQILGWQQEPHYDDVTKNLEWAILAESEGEQVVNYNTRLLGRKGVMEVQLVVDPAELPATLPMFKGLLGQYEYQAGERYADYQQGDKLAKYGLAALITGAGIAAAAKTGLLAWVLVFFKKAWKLVVVAVVAVGVFFKRLVTGRSEPRTLNEAE